MQKYTGGDVLITPREVARLLGVCDETLRLWRRDGRFIEPVNLTGRPRWRLSDVLTLKEGREAKRSTDPTPTETYLHDDDLMTAAAHFGLV